MVIFVKQNGVISRNNYFSAWLNHSVHTQRALKRPPLGPEAIIVAPGTRGQFFTHILHGPMFFFIKRTYVYSKIKDDLVCYSRLHLYLIMNSANVVFKKLLKRTTLRVKWKIEWNFSNICFYYFLFS